MLSEKRNLIKRMAKSVITATVTAAIIVPSIPAFAASPGDGDFVWIRDYNFLNTNVKDYFGFEPTTTIDGNNNNITYPATTVTKNASKLLGSYDVRGLSQNDPVTNRYIRLDSSGGEVKSEGVTETTGNNRLKVTANGSDNAILVLYSDSRIDGMTSQQSYLMQWDVEVEGEAISWLDVECFGKDSSEKFTANDLIEVSSTYVKVKNAGEDEYILSGDLSGNRYTITLDFRGDAKYYVYLNGVKTNDEGYSISSSAESFCGLNSFAIKTTKGSAYYDNIRFMGIKGGNASADASLKITEGAEGVELIGDTGVSISESMTVSKLKEKLVGADLDTTYEIYGSDGELLDDNAELLEDVDYTITSTAPNTITMRNYTMSVGNSVPTATVNENPKEYKGESDSSSATLYVVDVEPNGQAIRGVDVTVKVTEKEGESAPDGIDTSEQGYWKQTKTYTGNIAGDGEVAFGVLISRPLGEVKDVEAAVR